MTGGRGVRIPGLFKGTFEVDAANPFARHLNRLEVEMGGEDYGHLKRVELVAPCPGEEAFARMGEITERVIKTTQNNYNRHLIKEKGIRIYLDAPTYRVYYRMGERCVRFCPLWREEVLCLFFGELPLSDTGWCPCGALLPGGAARYINDGAGGVLMLRCKKRGALLTATHGPYDPHSFEVLLHMLRVGLGAAGLVNLGFSGREPLADENLAKLRSWGLPLNPSNIDVIYPYVDERGHPYCYKLEEGFGRYVALLAVAPPSLIFDLHGCVATRSEDQRLVVGLGGLPPYPDTEVLGRWAGEGEGLRLNPNSLLARGLEVLRRLSPDISLQLCSAPHRGVHLVGGKGRTLTGRCFDPRREVRSLLPGEERSYLPREDVRWLPGAGGNALQRKEALKLNPGALCLHVEMPLRVRRRIAESLAPHLLRG